MPNFKIEDAQKVLDRLKTEIGDSEKWRTEKEELVGLLSMVVNMPNLIKENKTLETAINKNRTMLTAIEDEVTEKKIWSKGRHKVLDAEVLASETRVTEEGNNAAQAIADIKDNLDNQTQEYQANAGKQMRECDDQIKDKKEELSRITGECDAAENRLRLFKENVASIPVDV